MRVRERRGDNARCPLCRVRLVPEDPERYLCPGCNTAYHGDCVQELGGCSTLGCPRVGVDPDDPTPEEQSLRARLRRRQSSRRGLRAQRRELRREHRAELPPEHRRRYDGFVELVGHVFGFLIEGLFTLLAEAACSGCAVLLVLLSLALLGAWA